MTCIALMEMEEAKYKMKKMIDFHDNRFENPDCKSNHVLVT